MALTVTAAGAPNSNPQASIGNLKVTFFDITFDSSYATAGETLTAADLGMSTIVHVAPTKAVTSSRTTSVDVFYDIAAGKLVAYRSNNGANDAEVANGQDLSTLSCRLMVFGV